VKENLLHLLNCWVCGMPYESIKAGSRCCRKPECRMAVWEIDTILVLRHLLDQSRWTGGPGFPTWEECVEEAVKRLPVSSEPLAEVLIELLEETARGINSCSSVLASKRGNMIPI
jgi:hypothetical protein